MTTAYPLPTHVMRRPTHRHQTTGYLTLLLLLLISITASSRTEARVLHREQSLYRNILITEDQGKICMKFSFRRDRLQSQSCYWVGQPQKLVFDYAKLISVGLLAKPQAKSILIVGLGGGTLVNLSHTLIPGAQITAVEIDPAVEKMAQQYFSLQPQPWLSSKIQDGRLFIKRALLHKRHYDLVILDAFNGDYIPEHLMTREFLSEVKQLIGPRGLVISNTFSSSRLYDYESATYQFVFGHFYQLRGNHSGNRVILASTHLPPAEQLLGDISRRQAELHTLGINAAYLRQAFERKPRWQPVTRLLSDDYSPVNLLR